MINFEPCTLRFPYRKKHLPHLLFQKFCYATCMNNSPDGLYIFTGLPCGMVVVEALSQQIVGSWEADNAEMAYIRSYTLAPQVYLIVTIDDMGKVLEFLSALSLVTYSKTCPFLQISKNKSYMMFEGPY